jgi:hypothetical protein
MLNAQEALARPLISVLGFESRKLIKRREFTAASGVVP